MKSYNKEVVVTCDVQKDWQCHFECHSVLHWWEGKMIAHNQFKKQGWIIGKQDICPYCAEHITQNKK